MNLRVEEGDCLDVLRGIADCSIDSVCTDPPYALVSITKRFGKEGAAPAKSEGATGVYKRASAGFMGKVWDTGERAFAVEFWQEVYRVLKPGGHVAAFGGTRTYHRLACAIEDAGFEIRDQLGWTYGCLSEDTDVLTQRGWLRYAELDDSDEVLQWDSVTDTLTWTQPTAVHVYPFAGHLVNLRNRHSRQLLTPNHRVYAKVRRHSRHDAPTTYEVLSADDIDRRSGAWRVTLPMAAKLHDGVGVECWYAYLAGWWMTDAWAHRDANACMFSQAKPRTLEKLRAALAPHGASEYIKTHKNPNHQDEHSFYLSGPVAARLRKDFPERQIPWSVLKWDRDARESLLNGLMDGDGSQPEHCPAKEHLPSYGHSFWSLSQERRDVFVALATSLGIRAFDDPKKGVVYLNRKTGTTEIQGKHRAQRVPYVGDVWCLTVPTGAFVVRREGRPFITGNSGFPKSHDVSKGIDKAGGLSPKEQADILRKRRVAAGMTRAEVAAQIGCTEASVRDWEDGRARATGRAVEHISPSPEYRSILADLLGYSADERRSAGISQDRREDGTVYGLGHSGHLTAGGNTDAAKQWQGWGTALKPAWEPICLARKPLIGTVVENVLAHGTGAINIDACRAPTYDKLGGGGEKAETSAKFTNDGWRRPWMDDPAALEVQAAKVRANVAKAEALGRWPANLIHDGSEEVVSCFPSAPGQLADVSRDAPSAKTSNVYGKMNREGEASAERRSDSGSAARFFACCPYDTEDGVSRIFYHAKANKKDRAGSKHPTVKPVALMKWLTRLITPPGGTVLDPFAGSGTTGQAALEQGFSAILIEREDEYLADIRRRLAKYLPASDTISLTTVSEVEDTRPTDDELLAELLS